METKTMETKTKWIIGISSAVVILGATAYLTRNKWMPLFKKGGENVKKGGANTTQKTKINDSIAVIDKQLANPELLKFLDASDVKALKDQKAKLQTELSGLA